MQSWAASPTCYFNQIQAPLSIRIKRVMERENIQEWEKAEAIVKESDRLKSSFVEFSYGMRWDEATAFDLVIDTGKVSPELTIN